VGGVEKKLAVCMFLSGVSTGLGLAFFYKAVQIHRDAIKEHENYG
jgi:uncharacterized membrane protein